MKKVLLLFVALFVVTSVKAQISPITFGPKVGYQTTKLSADKQVIKSDFKGNMAFGLFARLTIKNIVVQPELLYYKSGKILEVSAFDNMGFQNADFAPTITINQSNFALPIFFGYQFVDVPLFKMRANVGPVFYFAVGATEYTSTLLNTSASIKTNESSAEDVAIGAAFNLGLDIWKLTLDVNYSIGLTEALDDDIELPGVPEIEIGENTKQNIFTVTLGFKIL